MALDCIKRYIRSGLYKEARNLIEKEDNTYILMSDYDQITNDMEAEFYDLPLLVLVSLIKDEDSAVSLSGLLLEKGYHIEISDKNGLCALNYAIALKRIKLINLLLSSFEFELNTYRDCYKNSFLHYAYATNNKEIIDKFCEVYSKYYEWNPNKFKHIVNCDGLSVHDLYEYHHYIKKQQSLKNQLRLNRSLTANSFHLYTNNKYGKISDLYKIPDCFKCDSNPIVICKYINQVYNSNSTIKTDLIYVKNNNNNQIQNAHKSNKDFKLNILYQIRSLNKKCAKPQTSNDIVSYTNLKRPKTGNSKYLVNNLSFSPIKLEYDTMPIISKANTFISNNNENENFQLNKFSETWRSRFEQLFGDYSVINSPSYRTSSALTFRPINIETLNSDLLNKMTNNSELSNHTSKDKSRNSSPISQEKLDLKSKSPSQNKLDNYLVPGSILNHKHKK